MRSTISGHHCFRSPEVEGLQEISSYKPALVTNDYDILPLTLVTNDVVDGMFVHTLPGELLVRQMPLEHLPEHHRAREDIDLVVVLRVWVPKLGGLPVHGPDETSNHRSGGLLDFGKPKVCDLRNASRGNEDV